nr:hypothetical protein [Tanacetum cinerariifolium]
MALDNLMRTNPLPRLGEGIYTPKRGRPCGLGLFAFGQKPAFGGFGSTPTSTFGTTSTTAFGNTGSAFGVSNSPFGSSTPAFGNTSTPAFGVPSTPPFGVSATPAFGAPSSPAFGSTPTTTFGATGSAFSFGSSPAFSQSTSAFGSCQFRVQSSMFGSQATTPVFRNPNNFAQTSFVTQQCAESKPTPYAQTPAGKLESISAMPAYKEKSHEELRWEDYQAGDKGGTNLAGQSSGGMGFNTTNTQPNPFSSSPSFTQPATNPFSSTTTTNPFAQKTLTFAFGTSTSIFGTTQAQGTTPAFGTGMNFGTQSANLFQSSSPALGQTSSPFRQTGLAFGQTGSASSSPFGTPTSAFGTSTSIFGTTQAQGTTLAFGTGMNFGTQSANLFQSSSPALGPTSSPFGQTGSAFRQTGSAFRQTGSASSSPFGLAFGQSAPAFGQPNAFSRNMFSSTPSLQNTSNLIFNQTPVVDKPTPMRISFVLTTRHLSQSRIRLPAWKYHPKKWSSMVKLTFYTLTNVICTKESVVSNIVLIAGFFFSDEEETMRTPKADALFIPMENPRALVIRPLETWPRKASAKKPKGVSSPAQTNCEYTQSASTSHQNGRPTNNGNGNHSENSFFKEQPSPVKITQKSNGLHDDQSTSKSNTVEKYTEMLKRKAEDQGAEFVSYDPIKGEWKFSISHF